MCTIAIHAHPQHPVVVVAALYTYASWQQGKKKRKRIGAIAVDVSASSRSLGSVTRSEALLRLKVPKGERVWSHRLPLAPISLSLLFYPKARLVCASCLCSAVRKEILLLARCQSTTTALLTCVFILPRQLANERERGRAAQLLSRSL